MTKNSSLKTEYKSKSGSELAVSAFKEMISHSGDKETLEALKSGDEERIKKAMMKNVEMMTSSIKAMTTIIEDIRDKYPDVVDSYNEGLMDALSSMSEYVACTALNTGEDDLMSMWAFPDDTKNAYAVCSYMLDRLVDNFVTKMFTVKTDAEANQAVYNMLINLAANRAKMAFEDYHENIDYIGILEDGTFLKKTNSAELVVDGEKCNQELPGNKYREQLWKERRSAGSTR